MERLTELIRRRSSIVWTLCAMLGLGATRWAYRDYQEFLSLGPGGAPYNIFGWAIVTFLIRPLGIGKGRATSTLEYPDHGAHEAVLQLPNRHGERPVVKGVIPHRQMSDQPAESMRHKISALFNEAVERNQQLLDWKKSLYEKHNSALFVKESVVGVPETTIVSRREIGHPHGDMSVHLYLSPADAKVALDKGWAERHLLTTPRMRGRHLDITYLLFYGARDTAELDVLRVFLKHSIIYMTGTEEISL